MGGQLLLELILVEGAGRVVPYNVSILDLIEVNYVTYESLNKNTTTPVPFILLA
jgi:hypothetical protein